MRNHLTKVGLVVLVAVAALPVWASSGGAMQGPQQEQEIEQRIKAEIAKAMEELRVEMERLRAELSTLSEDRMQRIEILEPRLEAMVVDRERAREMAERAREMARQATENFRYDFRVEPGGVLTLHRSGGGYGEAVIEHAEELALSEVQQDQIREVQREYERARIARGADIEVAEMDLEALDDDPAAAIPAIRSALEGLSTLRIDGQIADRELRRDVREILTVEQREQFDEIWGPRARQRAIAIRRSR